MNVDKHKYTRRESLEIIGLGTSATPGLFVSNPLRSTTEEKAEGFSFAQVCDPQFGFGKEGYHRDVESFKKAVHQVNALNPDFVVICGDLVHKRDNPQAFPDFKEIKAGFNMPCYCASGNHDIGTKPTLKWVKHYRETIGDDYFFFEHKGYAFVIVNTQFWKSPIKSETEKQDHWLKETLTAAAERARPIFIVGHIPLFLKNPDEPDEYWNLPLAKRQELIQLYEETGVVAVLGGHTHRLVENEHNGIQYLNGETTSKNSDGRPLGFRVWHVADPRPYRNAFFSLEGAC